MTIIETSGRLQDKIFDAKRPHAHHIEGGLKGSKNASITCQQDNNKHMLH